MQGNSISVIPLKGRFYYSKRQRRGLNGKGRHRTFCLINGEVLEYTEMLDFGMPREYPGDSCFYEDAIYLGEGEFSHFKDL